MKIIVYLIGFFGTANSVRMENFHKTFSIKENFMEVASMFMVNCNLGGCSFLID